MPRIGLPELIVILVIALVIFGPSKLPSIGKSMGEAINEFKKASTELGSKSDDISKVDENSGEKK